MSGETATRGVEGVGLFEDEHRSAICGAQCMHACMSVHDLSRSLKMMMVGCVVHNAHVCV